MNTPHSRLLSIRMLMVFSVLAMSSNITRAESHQVSQVMIQKVEYCPSGYGPGFSDVGGDCFAPTKLLDFKSHEGEVLKLALKHKKLTKVLTGSKVRVYEIIAVNPSQEVGYYSKPGFLDQAIGVIGDVATAYNQSQGIQTQPVPPSSSSAPAPATVSPQSIGAQGQTPGHRTSNDPGTLRNVGMTAPRSNPAPATLPSAASQPASNPLPVSVQGLQTLPPVSTGQSCQPPCPTGMSCTGNVTGATIWQQTTRYTINSSAQASVRVMVNMSDGSQQSIPMYVVRGSSSHEFTMNVACDIYSPHAINATQASVSY